MVIVNSFFFSNGDNSFSNADVGCRNDYDSSSNNDVTCM